MTSRSLAMKLNYFILLIFLAFFCTSTQCDEPVPTVRLYVANKCSEPIHVDIFGFDTNVSTSSENWPYHTSASYFCEIQPRKSNYVNIEIFDWRDPNEMLFRFVVLKQSTLDRYSGKIDELLEKNIHDSVFVYSLAELKAMNYRITYSED